MGRNYITKKRRSKRKGKLKKENADYKIYVWYLNLVGIKGFCLKKKFFFSNVPSVVYRIK